MSGPDVGWSLAVGHRGEVVHTECTGPHTPVTSFDIASTSKQFTGLAALLTLELDDEVWRLLRHQTGLPDYIDLLKAAGHGSLDRTTTEDALAILEDQPLEFEPGTQWCYSNTNYLLLGIRIAEACGQPLPEVLDERIFGPLGLDMVMDPFGRVPHRATSFDEAGAPADSPWEQVGDGAMWSTPSELVRWADSYSTAPFGEEVLARQLRAVPAEGSYSYGAGICIDEIDGHQVLYHGGDWSGFRTWFELDPEARVAVAICANQFGLLADDHIDRVLADWRARLA
jgi:CubicO group peptidase (beta-lactamase class C family)